MKNRVVELEDLFGRAARLLTQDFTTHHRGTRGSRSSIANWQGGS
jgi:hypothetical protein